MNRKRIIVKELKKVFYLFDMGVAALGEIVFTKLDTTDLCLRLFYFDVNLYPTRSRITYWKEINYIGKMEELFQDESTGYSFCELMDYHGVLFTNPYKMASQNNQDVFHYHEAEKNFFHPATTLVFEQSLTSKQ